MISVDSKCMLVLHKFYASGSKREDAYMDTRELRKHLLGGKKTERIIFAATPETKAALEAIARDRCVSVSALITSLIIDEALRNTDVVAKEVVPSV